jgi:hypothetical protein
MRRKRIRAAQDYTDRGRTADDEERKAQQALAENEADDDKLDYHSEHERW